MKLKKTLNSLLIVALFLTLSMCKKNDPDADLVSPSNAQQLSTALVMPGGTTTIQGAMPTATNNAQSPKITSGANEYPVLNGSQESVSLNYSNLTTGIGGAYSQVEGSDSYFKTPLQSPNPGNWGSISFPIGIPQNLDNGYFTLVISIYDASGRVSNTIRLRFNVSRVLQAKAGKGTLTYNGKTINGDAICDVLKLTDLGIDSFQDASAFITEGGDMVFMYNVINEGTTKLGNANNYNFDTSRSAWLYFMSGSSYRFMVSTGGTVVRNGKSIIFNATVQELDETNSRSENVSGSIRCQ